MTVNFCDPVDGSPLRAEKDALVSAAGRTYPIVNGVPRFCEVENYTASFGEQWNMFDRTQIDGEQGFGDSSSRRFFGTSGWAAEELAGLDVLEVGSGAGRFSDVLLRHTRANLHSVDYSNAVEANYRTNGQKAPDRFRLAQASVYDMPFPDASFDRTFCFGVLQHTPDFSKSVAALIRKTKPGGQIAVDFYPVRGWWTKLHAKYLLRPFTKGLKRDALLKLIDRNVDWLIPLSERMNRVGLHALTRFLPLVDLKTLPRELKGADLREAVVLDTFDMFSPAFDNPQTVAAVARMFEEHGATVTFADFLDVGFGPAATVRGTRR